MEELNHWENIFQSKDEKSFSWFQTDHKISLETIEKYSPDKNAKIIDIGCGTAQLIDALYENGFNEIDILDISSSAIDKNLKRLEEKGAKPISYIGDITQIDLPSKKYDVWHDRAVFHFLTKANQRQAYLQKLKLSLKPDGIALIATFSKNGPQKCSGLEIVQYDSNTLLDEMGSDFKLLTTMIELHKTPSGNAQEFIYCVFRLK